MKELIKSKIKTVPNWPKPGIMFRDITSLLEDPEGWPAAINEFIKRYKDKNIDKVVGIESRGFIIGSAIAHALGIGFIPIRKPNKLPRETEAEEYELEYGKDKIEVHKDAIKKGEKVLLVDDLIATGGTATAACNLIKRLGGEIIECAFVIDLPELKGSQKLKEKGYKVFSLVEFEGD